MRNSRKSESEADLVGTDIMYDTGYDPRQMAVFFEKLQSQGGSRAPQFLSDHPNPGNRAVAVMDEVATLPRKSAYRQDSAEFREIKQMASGRVSESPKSVQQQLEPAGSGSADAPEGNFRSLEQPGFRIGYPDNWQVSGGGEMPFVIAPNGASARSGKASAYSAMVGGFQSRGETDVGGQTRALFAAMEQRNPELKMVGSEQDIRVNGVPGKSVDLIGAATAGGGRERHWLVTVPQHGNGIIYLLFTAPEAEFDQMRPTFEEMVKSLHLH